MLSNIGLNRKYVQNMDLGRKNAQTVSSQINQKQPRAFAVESFSKIYYGKQSLA